MGGQSLGDWVAKSLSSVACPRSLGAVGKRIILISEAILSFLGFDMVPRVPGGSLGLFGALGSAGCLPVRVFCRGGSIFWARFFCVALSDLARGRFRRLWGCPIAGFPRRGVMRPTWVVRHS